MLEEEWENGDGVSGGMDIGLVMDDDEGQEGVPITRAVSARQSTCATALVERSYAGWDRNAASA